MATGDWSPLEFKVPTPLEGLRDNVTDVANWLLGMLDMTQALLDFVQSFLIDFANPILNVVQKLRDIVQGILRDLTNLGVYLTSDVELLRTPKALLGGYQAFETRMVKKLSDTSDLTRPIASPATKVLGLFAYTSTDVSGFDRMVRTLLGLVGYFRASPALNTGLPPARITRVLYGASGSVVPMPVWDLLTGQRAPTQARIFWSPLSDSATDPFEDFLAPTGFLLSISTTPDPVTLWYDNELGSFPLPVNGSPGQCYGVPVEGATYGALKPGVTRVYGKLGAKQLVPVADGGPYHKLFWIPPESAWLNKEFSFTIPFSDFPQGVEVSLDGDSLQVSSTGPTSRFWVRVAACMAPDVKVALDVVQGRVQATTTAGLGAFSAPYEILFVDQQAARYHETLKAALMVLALSRPDLTPLDELTNISESDKAEIRANKALIEGVAPLRTGLEGARHFIPELFPSTKGVGVFTVNTSSLDAYQEALEEVSDASPTIFRRDLSERVTRVAEVLHRRWGSKPELERMVVESCGDLLSTRWRDLLERMGEEIPSGFDTALSRTPLASLTEPDIDVGIARNPLVISTVEEGWDAVESSVVTARGAYLTEVVTRAVPERWAKQVRYTIPEAEVEAFLATCPKSLKAVYEHAWDPITRSITVPEEWKPLIDMAASEGPLKGSADLSPVFYYQDTLGFKRRILYCRSLLAPLYPSAQRVLALQNRNSTNAQGAWIYQRWFDSMPGFEDLLNGLLDWSESLVATASGVVDQIRRTIESLKRRIDALQGFIRRLNEAINAFLGFGLIIPKASMLVVTSDGTDGLLQDFITAERKPSDSPYAYGSGLAVVIPMGNTALAAVVKGWIMACWSPIRDRINASMEGKIAETKAKVYGALPPPPTIPDVPDTL